MDEQDSSSKRVLARLNKMILKRKASLSKLEVQEHFNKKFNSKIKKYLVNKKSQQQGKHAPFAFVLCSSAMRCIELQRLFDANNKYLKEKKLNWFHAFAKHKKLNEQIEYLNKKQSKQTIDLVYATPQRLTQLIEAKCFDLSQLKYVLVDYTHRDCKLKRFVDMNEIKSEFFVLLFKHLIYLNKQSENIHFKFYLL